MSDLRLDLRVSLGRISDALHRYVDVMVGARDDTVPADVGTVRIESRSLSDRAALDGVVATARAHGCDLLILTHTATAIVWPPACDISVLVLRPGTDPEWVRARLAQIGEDAGERRSADEMGRMSIVAIADRAAADVGGHIIVEDDTFQLLAYSRMTPGVDPARREAVLQRQLPGPYQQIFNGQGVLARLIAGTPIIQTESVDAAGLGQRLIAGIRHHGRLLGSIWLARDAPVFCERDAEVLRAAAAEMSPLLGALMRRRDDERVRRDEAVADLLSGKEPADPRTALGYGAPDFTRPGHAIALKEVNLPRSRQAMDADAIRVLADVTARSRRAATLSTTADGVAFMLHLGCDSPAAECSSAGSATLAKSLSESFSGMGATIAVAVGRHWSDTSGIEQSANDADRMVRKMARDGRTGLATLADLWAPLTLAEALPEQVPRAALPETVRQLFAKTSRAREQRRVLAVLLDDWGNPSAAAARLGIHTNTVRYRLRRFEDQLKVDLNEPDARLVLWMLLRTELHL